MAECICCANFGRLPHEPGDVTLVPGDVVRQMCGECIGAAFLGSNPHPHPFRQLTTNPRDPYPS